MGSRDVSRWVFKLTADPICPPLIPEWYLSLLEFYIVSSVSNSVLALLQIVILLTSSYLALSPASRMEYWLNSQLLWLSNTWRTPDGALTWSSLPNPSRFPVSICFVHHCPFSLINRSRVAALCARQWSCCKIHQNFDGYLFLFSTWF